MDKLPFASNKTKGIQLLRRLRILFLISLKGRSRREEKSMLQVMIRRVGQCADFFQSLEKNHQN